MGEAGHNSRSSDSVSDEQGIQVPDVAVDVHVPEARNEELATGVDGPRSLRSRDLSRKPERLDTIAADDDGHSGCWRLFGPIDDGYSVKDNSWRLRIEAATEQDSAKTNLRGTCNKLASILSR